MAVYIPDHQPMSSLQPGDVYRLSLPNVGQVIGAVFKGSGDGVFGIDLDGSSAFQVRRLDSEHLCTRLATGEKVRFGPDGAPCGVNVPRGFGCVFSTRDHGHFLRFALPDQEAQHDSESAFASLATWTVQLPLPENVVSVHNKWSLLAGDKVLFSR